MQTIFCSTDINLIEEWEKRAKPSTIIDDFQELLIYLKQNPNAIVIADYDSCASQINRMIAAAESIDNLIILEKVPVVITGKYLITHGIKAYGNSRMLKIHYNQMIETVKNGKIWTYPDLTIALTQAVKQDILSTEATEMIKSRLTDKEQDVVYFILEGLTNDAIAKKLNITPRTVKAHISSIFSKLHVNDRLALVLLLK